jgi:hypothetical protein
MIRHIGLQRASWEQGLQVQLADGVTVSVRAGAQPTLSSALEDRLRVALTHVGELARAQDRGVALLFDETHSVYDRKTKRQFPLGALLSALVAAQDEDEQPLPVMLALCGLPPLIDNIHAACSNAERLFRGEEIGNLPLAPRPPAELSPAAQALLEPASDIAYESGVSPTTSSTGTTTAFTPTQRRCSASSCAAGTPGGG